MAYEMIAKSFDLEKINRPTVAECKMGPIEITMGELGLTITNDGVEWMTYNAEDSGQYNQLYSSYDLAYGDVLISGLGFGLLAYWLADKAGVNSITVVEQSADIIEIFKVNNPDFSDKIKIINDDMTTYSTDIKYDCILLDHYETQDYSWCLEDMAQICKRIKHDIFWAWSLEPIYLWREYGALWLKDYDFDGIKNSFLESNGNRLNDKWSSFIESCLPSETKLLSLRPEQLNTYLEVYFYMNRDGRMLAV